MNFKLCVLIHPKMLLMVAKRSKAMRRLRRTQGWGCVFYNWPGFQID